MIRLSDSEFDALMAAAKPIPIDRRDSFLKAVAAALAGVSVGPGSLHRVIAQTQKLYLDPPLATEDEEPRARRRVHSSKYG